MQRPLTLPSLLLKKNLLSIAYKNFIAGRRASLKRIRSIEKKETKKGNTDNVSFIKDHRVKIETEINNICDRIFNLIDSHLLPNASTDDSKVFYLKMKGDYHRYLFYSKTGAARVQAVKDTLEIYKSAQVIRLSLTCDKKTSCGPTSCFLFLSRLLLLICRPLTYRDWVLLLTCLFSTMRPSCQLRLRV